MKEVNEYILHNDGHLCDVPVQVPGGQLSLIGEFEKIRLTWDVNDCERKPEEELVITAAKEKILSYANFTHAFDLHTPFCTDRQELSESRYKLI